MPTTQTPFIGRLSFIYQSIGQIISFLMMPPLRSFDDLDGKERGQKKTDDLRAMTTLGPRTLCSLFAFAQFTPRSDPLFADKLPRNTVMFRFLKGARILSFSTV